MTILIKGMEMPEFGALNIFVLPDGKVLGEVSGQAPLRLNILGTAVSVPTPHGRLIDADEANDNAYDVLEICHDMHPWEAAREMQKIFFRDAPTVIEAEKEG